MSDLEEIRENFKSSRELAKMVKGLKSTMNIKTVSKIQNILTELVSGFKGRKI